MITALSKQEGKGIKTSSYFRTRSIISFNEKGFDQTEVYSNSVPDDKCLDWSILKAFADDHIYR